MALLPMCVDVKLRNSIHDPREDRAEVKRWGEVQEMRCEITGPLTGNIVRYGEADE